MPKSYSNFKASHIGLRIDLDGFPVNQKFQCWDLANKYFLYIGGKKIHCAKTGYVQDIANQRATNGILDFCDDIGLHTEMQPGDIVVWKPISPHCPLSHIAIYDHDNGQNEIYFLGQNQPYPWVTVQRIPWQGIIAVFRPKIFSHKEVAPSKPDQILTVGSKVTSYGFYVERLRWKNGGWQMYNAWVGGWIPTKDVDEVDALDGKKDQILHIGSGCAFPGTYTVTAVNPKEDTCFLKELGYWVKCRCVCEVQEGR